MEHKTQILVVIAALDVRCIELVLTNSFRNISSPTLV